MPVSAPPATPPVQPAERLARHILPTAGTMVGLCTTLIGLVKVVEARIGPSHVDEASALVSLLFLASAVSAYLSIRYEARGALSRRCERVADLAFLAGLVSLTLVSLLFAYEVV